METSLERIRAKIADLETKIADLRIAERELLALDTVPARQPKAAPNAAPKPKTQRKPETAAPSGPRKTIGSAIADVLGEHGPLPVADIADRIKETGRDINRRTVSYSLQAMKKQGLVKAGDGKWALPKPRSASARA